MRYSSKITSFITLTFLLLNINTIKAQCVFINNLPDTVLMCKNSTLQLNPSITSPGQLTTIDTTWTPAAGLNNPNIINPIATVGTTSAAYKLSIKALTPFNFVNNGNFSSGNTGFTSNYILGTGEPWGLVSNDGTYAITTNPSIVHTNFANFGDHTTGTGQMMVVNGSSVPNTSVWCQSITVIPNSDYDFSAWSASCVSSAPAILQFSINGINLGTPYNLPGVTGVWGQFHATWFSGTSTTATICIVNQNTQPSGNDFAIDDIEFREICTTSDSVYLKVVNLQPAINYTPNLGCLADTIAFQAVNNADTPSQYIWDFGDGMGSPLMNPTHVYSTQGIYNVKLVTKKNGCSDSATVQINTLHPLSIDFTMSDDSICIGEAIQYTSTASGTSPLTYYWDFGDNTFSAAQAPTHTYINPGVYTVLHVVHDTIPCYDTIRKTVVVDFAPSIKLTVSDTVLCEGEGIDMSGYISAGQTQIIWDFADGNFMFNTKALKHAYDVAGSYNLTLTAKYPQCPDAVATKNIQVFAAPKVDIGSDTSICPNGAPIVISNKYFDPTNINQWNTGDQTAAITARHPGIYEVTATNAAGCSTSDSMEVFKNCYLDIPNAFTPNGDGVNDYFLPRQLLSKSLSKFYMKIFDRWGQLIFETTSLNGRGWDGKFNDKAQPGGVYVYIIEAEINKTWVEKYEGNVTLLR